MPDKELKKKIECILAEYNFETDYGWILDTEEIAKTLIAEGIGDVKEAEYQVKILKRALRIAVSKIEYLQFQISTRQECPISIPDIEDEDCEPYIIKAEDELFEEENTIQSNYDTNRKRTRGGEIMSEQFQLDKKKVIQFLTIFKAMGFEVIKSNYGQTALNTVKNDMPMVLNNNVGYMTPLPYKWEFIEDEIKRLQKELAEEGKDGNETD